MQTPTTTKAKLTGRTIEHPAGTLYEVLCPNQDCVAEQVHRLGTWPCILCGTRFSAQIFHIVEKPPAKLPEAEKETLCLEEKKSP